MDMLAQMRGERAAVPEMRSHIAWYLHGARIAARLRAEINGIMTSMEQVRDALTGYLRECEGGDA
jgi:tRNA-dihydrouridine synthase